METSQRNKEIFLQEIGSDVVSKYRAVYLTSYWRKDIRAVSVVIKLHLKFSIEVIDKIFIEFFICANCRYFSGKIPFNSLNKEICRRIELKMFIVAIERD